MKIVRENILIVEEENFKKKRTVKIKNKKIFSIKVDQITKKGKI